MSPVRFQVVYMVQFPAEGRFLLRETFSEGVERFLVTEVGRDPKGVVTQVMFQVQQPVEDDLWARVSLPMRRRMGR